MLRHGIDEGGEHAGAVVVGQAAAIPGSAGFLETHTVCAHDVFVEPVAAEGDIARVADPEIVEDAEPRGCSAGIDDGHDPARTGARHLVAEQAAALFDSERLDVDYASQQTGGLERGVALFDAFRSGGNDQHILHVRMAAARTDDIEVEADFLHGKRYAAVGFEFQPLLQFGAAQMPRHLDDSRDSRVAAESDRRFPGAASGPSDRAANGIADRLGVDDRRIADGLRRTGFSRESLDAIAAPVRGQLDQLDG